jgi:hypothetical protein
LSGIAPPGKAGEPDEKPQALCCRRSTVAANAARSRSAGEAGYFLLGKTDLAEHRDSVFAERCRALSR